MSTLHRDYNVFAPPYLFAEVDLALFLAVAGVLKPDDPESVLTRRIDLLFRFRGDWVVRAVAAESERILARSRRRLGGVFT